jgi:hypothetical protein
MLARLRDEIDDHLRAFEQLRASARQPDTSPVAHEKRCAEFFLELRNLAAQGRLCDVQLGCSAAETPHAGNVDERAQFSDFDDGLR